MRQCGDEKLLLTIELKGDLGLVGRHAQTYFNLWLICAEMPRFIAVAGHSTSLGAAFDQAVLLLLRWHYRCLAFERVTS
jgi:hypothetical protein